MVQAATLYDVTGLIGVIAWPLVVVAGFLLFRREVPHLVQALGGRVRAVSIVGISVEFAAKEFTPPINAVSYIEELQGRMINGDSISYLVEELQKEESAEYIVIDLNTIWWSSRLFLFAELLRRAHGLNCLVFVANLNHRSRGFVGLSSPDAVCQALIARQPWLGVAYIKALAEAYERLQYRGDSQQYQPDPETLARRISEVASLVQPRITPRQAKELAEGYRAALRLEQHNDSDADWNIVSYDEKEHTTRVTPEWLAETLADNLVTSDRITDTADMTKEALRRAVVLQGSSEDRWIRYVAGVNKEGVFRRLFNRERLVEAIAREVALQDDSSRR
jgi:hypothetical protein